MATRASIKFSDNQGNFIANVYHHWDGYPEYLGAKLLELTQSKVTNGLRMRSDGTHPVLGEVFNGIGCLFASVVAKLKTEPGNVYMYSESDYGNCGEDYLYEIIENNEGDGVEVFVMNQSGEWEFVSEILERTNQLYQND
jgi:hypothetical protein